MIHYENTKGTKERLKDALTLFVNIVPFVVKGPSIITS